MTGGRDLGDAEGASGSRRGRPANRPGDIYRRLGVEPIINGRSTFTILGGSLIATPVSAAMREAAEAFVDLIELQAAVGRRIAELTRNEAAFVSGGAAAGLFLAAAACICRDTVDGVLAPDVGEDLPREFVIHRAHRIPYDLAIRLAGGRLVEIGTDDGVDLADFERALSASTAAVLYVPKEHLARAVLPLETVVALAHGRGVPIIVDAAAQLPPPANLWRFTGMGADLALFSGGKALCGPASTGLVLGRAALVERLGRNAAPLQRLGRPMKVGKEDLVGVLAAVEWYLGQDHEALARQYEEQVAHFVEWGRGRRDLTIVREAMGEAGQPTPRAWIRLVSGSTLERDALLRELREETPRIDLLADGVDGFYVAPETLLPGEERIISRRLDDVLGPLADHPES